jgi:CRP/FNR family transcriptional regulator, cyclic AMP receptor protein
VVLEVLDRPGAHFGVMALLSGSPRTASVATLEDCRFMVISREHFLNCLRLSPKIALDIMAHLVEKVGLLTERMSSFALDEVYSRLAVSLRQLAQEEGGRLITPPVTQQDLAGMINASREMVSRIFKELRAGDYIEIEGKRIVLKKTLPAGW